MGCASVLNVCGSLLEGLGLRLDVGRQEACSGAAKIALAIKAKETKLTLCPCLSSSWVFESLIFPFIGPP